MITKPNNLPTGVKNTIIWTINNANIPIFKCLLENIPL